MYWEISRLARGLPKTFTYSDWDAKAKMMYHVDMEGNMCYEKINLREERIDLLENPMLGPLLRRKEQLLEDDLMTKRANRVAVYYLNIHKRYDLDVSIRLSRIPADVRLILNSIELSTLQANQSDGLCARSMLQIHDDNRTC
mgnify:CR=1 FL=1